MHGLWTKKTSNRASYKEQLTLTVRGERRLRRNPSTYESTIVNVHHRDARLAWSRERRDWSAENWKRVTWRDESRFLLLNTDERLRIWRQAYETMDPAGQVGNVQGNGVLIMVWGVFSNTIWDLWCVYQPPSIQFGVKGYHIAREDLTELWTALANIWQVIPVERFQKVESMPRRVAAVIKARGGPTRYWVGTLNSDAL
ncbi:transposable element Tcb2 transposase [Trichonephila clavipes]|nr:transposable element Tcb2 transposase [Trichonephila clavipes]